MKIRNILVLLFGIALCACSRHSDFKSALDEAESLMREHPDSAYRMLCGMNGRADSVSTSLRMRHLLLRSNAQNKSDVLFTSDSIGTILVEYYDSYGTPNERMLAHYMKGCAHRDMGEWPSAVRCFNEAVAAADTASADCNFPQLSIVYGQLGYIYGWQYLIEEALQAYAHAEQYAQDTLSILNIWEQKSNALIQKGKVDEGLRIKEEIIAHDVANGRYQSAAITKGACINCYVQKGDFEMAKACLDDYEALSGYFLPNGDIRPGMEDYYYTKGTYYMEKDDLDSAEYCYRKLHQLGTTVNDHYLAALGLTCVYQGRHQADSVAKYAWQTFQYNDSLYDDNVAKNLQQAQVMYNYSRHQEMAYSKSVEAKEAQIRLRNFIILGTILISLIVLLLMFYRRRLRLKMVRLKRKMHSRLSQNSAVVDMLTRDIEEKAQLIASLHRQLDENEVNLQESEQMKQTIGILEQQIQEYKRVMDSFTQSLNSSRLQEEPAIAQFMQMAKEGKRRPTKEEWHRVFMLVERHYPGMLKIKSHKDVNPKEYRICVLLKLGLDIQSIKFVENTYNSDISVVRSRLLLKIYGIKGSSKDFDSRLAEI